MRTPISQSSAQDNRNGMFEALREIDPRLRFIIGLIACAVLAYYVPSVLIALTGVWVNNLMMMLPLLLAVIVLVVQGLIDNKLNKPFLIGVVFAVIIDGCAASLLVRTASSWAAFRMNWMLFFLPTVAFPLNAWLLGRYKAAVDLV